MVSVLNLEPKTLDKLRRDCKESLLRPFQFAFPSASLNRDCLLVQVDIFDVQSADFSAPDAVSAIRQKTGLGWLVGRVDDLFYFLHHLLESSVNKFSLQNWLAKATTQAKIFQFMYRSGRYNLAWPPFLGM